MAANLSGYKLETISSSHEIECSFNKG